MSCPICQRPNPAGEAPCAACWRDMPAADKAPWIHRIRTETVFAAVRHRDPVRDAPQTVRAYVAWLESR